MIWRLTSETPSFYRIKSGKAIGAAVSCSAIGGVASAILMMCTTGAIASYLLPHTGCSAAGVVLGLLLGKLGKSAFSKSMQLMDYDLFGFFEHPVAPFLTVLGFIAVFWSIVNEFGRPNRYHREAE